MREPFGSGRSMSKSPSVTKVRLLLTLFSLAQGLSLPAFTLGSTRSEISNDISDINKKLTLID